MVSFWIFLYSLIILKDEKPCLPILTVLHCMLSVIVRYYFFHLLINFLCFFLITEKNQLPCIERKTLINNILLSVHISLLSYVIFYLVVWRRFYGLKLYFLFVLATHCGDGWVEYENNCYLFLNKEMDFVNGLVSKIHAYTTFGKYNLILYIYTWRWVSPKKDSW